MTKTRTSPAGTLRVPIRCVLFDLDGTLADTAPDLGGAANDLLAELGQPAKAIDTYRPYISQGARGMLAVALRLQPEDADYTKLRNRYLDLYASRLNRDTRLFPEVEALLQHLDGNHLPWGIVTNKIMRFTAPVVKALGLASRAACIVAGDSAARPKPAPDPLLMACELLATAPATTLYVGDDPRDIEAGHAAGMQTAAACWGYLPPETDPARWGADFRFDAITDLTQLLELPHVA